MTDMDETGGTAAIMDRAGRAAGAGPGGASAGAAGGPAGGASGAGGAGLQPLGTLEAVLASDASPQVKAACIELAIAAEGRRGG